jgi:hypothetical protein
VQIGPMNARKTLPPLLLVLALLVFAYQGLVDRETGGIKRVQDHVITWSLSNQAVRQGAYFDQFAYPPPALVFKLVLGLPGMAVSSVLWMAVLLGSCFVVVRGLAELLRRPKGPPDSLAPILGFAVALYAVQWDLRAVNSNMAFLALVVGGLVACSRHRALAAGGLLAASVALKLYSALLIPLLAWRRQRRALVWTLAFLLLFFGALPALYLGPELALDLTRQWLAVVMHGSDPDFILGLRAYKASFAYVMLALLSDAPAAADTAWLTWPAQAVHWATRALQLAWLGAVGAWIASRGRSLAGEGAATGRTLLVDSSLLLMAALLLSPITQPHQCVVLILPAAVLADRALAAEARSRLRAALFALLAAAGLAPLLASAGVAKGVALCGVMIALSIGLMWTEARPAGEGGEAPLPAID